MKAPLRPAAGRLIRFLAVPLLAALLFSCATVPEIGRRQLLIVSPADESRMGLTEFQKLKQSTPVSQDAAANALVQRAGRRIAAVSPLPGAQWEFVVFDEPKTANAFCLPGGKVGVYTGILPVTRDEDGLATVIGHEVAHAVARHGGERMSEGLLIEFGGLLLNEAMQKNTEKTRALTMQSYGLGTTVGLMLPHSRQQELEADHLGLIYMARAGYDPRQAIAFWKRFADYAAGQGGRPLAFLSTHPLDKARIAQLESELPQALAEYQKAGGPL
jgi:predicted Zn-dependent protease